MDYFCAGCGYSIEDEVQFDSCVYGSRHLLCAICSAKEDCEMDKHGTNDLPMLLASYGPPNDEAQ